MKKIKLMFTTLFTAVFLMASVNADVTYDTVENGEGLIKNPSNTVGYKIDTYKCYSCRSKSSSGNLFDTATDVPDEGGIGVFFKGNEKWELGSFAGYDGSKSHLTALFTAFKVGSGEDTMLEVEGDRLNGKDEDSEIDVTITPEIYRSDSNFILLKYSVHNQGSDSNNVSVATFNDLYLNTAPIDASVAACTDNAAFTNIDQNIFKNINKGFVAKTGSNTESKYMVVTLDAPGVLKKDTGEFTYWTGLRQANSYPSEEVTNKYNSGSANGTKYTDSAFAYSWTGNVPANSTVEFETLIGLGNAEAPTIDIESLEPNYDTDKKQFTLDTDDKNIIVSGTITDKCGMGACTYKINDEEEAECDEATYYTTGSDYSTNYTVTIPTEKLTDVNENTFSVTANSVACGSDTATTSFTLYKDAEDNKQLGINNNYIALGIILLGGIGLYIYSRKQNKFPQV